MDKNRILLMAIYNRNMNSRYEEIGISSIASYLRQNNYEVKLVGTMEEDVDYNEIIKFQPTIIGFTMYTISKKSVYMVSKRIRELLPSVKIVVGGCLPTYYGFEILKEAPFIDYAIRGEGENVWLSLLKTLETTKDISKVKGITYRIDNAIIENEEQELIRDLNILPSPARDIIRDNKLKIAQVSTARGCMGRCSFCMSHKFWKIWRGRSVKNVVDEIETLVKEYGITTFDIIDGSMEDPDPKLKRLQSLANEIIRRNLKISFYADCRAEFHKKATPEIMNLLKQAGLCGVCVGIETGNEEDLHLYRKMATIEDNHKIIELFRKYDIFVDPGFINFNPYSTIEGLRANINYLEKYGYACRVEYLMNRYRMFKNTPLTDKIISDGLIVDGEFDDELRYTYVNKDIESLCRFLFSYTDGLSFDQKRAFFQGNFYLSKFQILMIFYKRQFTIEKAFKAVEITKQAEQNNSEICAIINKAIAQWFRRLIDLAESGWNDEKAIEISNHILFEEYDLVSLNKRLMQNRHRFSINIIKFEPNYEKILADYNNIG